MKQLIPAILIVIFFVAISSFVSTHIAKPIVGKEKIEITFIRDLEYADLVKIKQELSVKGISIEYRTLEFDKIGKLKRIGFFVDCKDGFSGEANTAKFSTRQKFGFYRDYDDRSAVHFFAGFF